MASQDNTSSTAAQHDPATATATATAAPPLPQQVVSTVIGHDLDDILFSSVPPPRTLVNGAPNLQYLQWNKRDQLLHSWLRSSMTKGILAVVASCTTSSQLWVLYPFSDYVDKVQSLSNSIITAGSSISDQDLILQLLNGLGPENGSFVSGITSRSDDLTIEEVQALVMAHESCLDNHNTLTDLTLKMQANLAYGPQKNGPSRPFQPAAKGFAPNNSSRSFG
ncbi:uncharacterized protein LOC133036212 [Cannabis sativa]|uniref:uncharacterized protein LOC133036212 n=1 Tax=Cannabis sativa TaxID=3483 RepID=UPI0029CA30CB|nr:uncharacterized protein LOC133036212 [Cannabis sativa]